MISATTAAPRLRPVALALALLGACSDPAAPEPTAAEAPPPPPTRIALLGAGAGAVVRGAPAPATGGGAVTQTRLAFEDAAELPPFFARQESRFSISWEEALDRASIDPAGGLSGGGLRLGPGLPQDLSRAALVLDGAPFARVTVTARVRLLDNPEAGESSSREALRLIEHPRAVPDPAALTRRERRDGRTHRVSRRFHPSGWDEVELEIVTGPETVALELQLLHRSGDSEAATTTFDDVVVAVEPLGDAELLAFVRERYSSPQTDEDASPWLVRASLRSADGRRSEVRDAVLLAPSMALAVPLVVPEAAPALRIAVAMPDEAAGAPGDGARVVVSFEPLEGGAAIALGAFDLDPKNDREQRRWLPASFDLGPVAGRAGTLVLAAADAPGTDPDPPDLLLLSTPRVEPSGEAPGRMNVLLIGVDTLRADRLSAFGYERATTPRLAALADEAVRFSSARSQAPWTLPSFASILTSLYPSSHGAGRGGHDEWTPIDPTTTSIAEVLGAEGWETQGIVANGFISPEYGLDQGFQAHQSAWRMESVAEDIGPVEEWIAAHTSTPWLLFWHIMDPHLPYQTPEEVRAPFVDAAYDGRFSRSRWGNMVPFEDLDPRPGRRWFVHEGPPPPPDVTEADARYISDYYDAELSEMDTAVGRALDALRASGQWERTVIAFVADHGEGLGDHDHYHHGYTLFDDQVHVPMILRIPGRDAGRVVSRPVASIDLAPTILGALGIPAPASWQGVDRLAPDAPTDDAYIIEYPTYDSSAQKAWVWDRFKYMHDPWFHTSALYDLEADPGELTDVAAAHPEVVARARAELDAFRWRELQKGRFHLRVTAPPGALLRVEAAVDDLLDANFAARPAPPEEDFSLDLDRRTLVLETTVVEPRIELVFWGRAETLSVDLSVDGEPLTGGLDVGLSGEADRVPATLARSAIPVLEGASLPWPPANAALLWLEAGVAPTAPVVLSPEQIEVLEQLGYTR